MTQVYFQPYPGNPIKSTSSAPIFRPWDQFASQHQPTISHMKVEPISYQDCTISTTTETTDEKHKHQQSVPIGETAKPPQTFHEIRVPLIDSETYQFSPIPAPKNTSTGKSVEKTKTKATSRTKLKTKLRPVSPPRNSPQIDANSMSCSSDYGFPSAHPGMDLNAHSLRAGPIFHHEMFAAAHAFGLPITDPVLLESLAQGYAMEEYARILSQDYHAKLLSNRKQRPKKYKCPHCDVGFSNNGQLKGHIRIHTGERPFRCDEKTCGKTFIRNEELTRHKRIHSGLRPYPCATCGKRFGRKDHLKKHARTHMATRAAGLQLVPVVLPADAWASIPPSAGLPTYHPGTSPYAAMSMYGF